MIDVDLTFSRPSFSLRAAFCLQDSGITVLRGDSESGKTTLADLLSGALAPASGRITATAPFGSTQTKASTWHPRNAASDSFFRRIGFFPISLSKKTSAFR